MTITINETLYYHLIGILLLAGALGGLVIAYCRAWFEGKRNFWCFFITKFSHDDPELQKFVRGFFLGGVVLALIGAIIMALSNPSIPKEFVAKFLYALYCMVVAWGLAKAIFLVAIIVHKIGQWIKGTTKEQNLAD